MTSLPQTLMHETEGLSWNALQEVLDFIRFLKFKEQQTPRQALAREQDLDQLLQTGEAESLLHVEAEFAHYRELYPHES